VQPGNSAACRRLPLRLQAAAAGIRYQYFSFFASWVFCAFSSCFFCLIDAAFYKENGGGDHGREQIVVFFLCVARSLSPSSRVSNSQIAAFELGVQQQGFCFRGSLYPLPQR